MPSGNQWAMSHSGRQALPGETRVPKGIRLPGGLNNLILPFRVVNPGRSREMLRSDGRRWRQGLMDDNGEKDIIPGKCQPYPVHQKEDRQNKSPRSVL